LRLPPYEPFHSYSNPYVLTLVSLRLFWLMRAYRDDMHIKPNCNFSDELTYRNDSQVVVERPDSLPPIPSYDSVLRSATGLSLRRKRH